MTSRLVIVLKLIAAICLMPALIHGFWGAAADSIVGVRVSSSAIDASYDSQNRFYGVAFGLYAVLLWVAAADIRKYAGILRIIFTMMFLAGCSRFLSLKAFGWPSDEVLFLWSTEILLPPILWLWLKRYEAAKDS
jgi:hypothetical protein